MKQKLFSLLLMAVVCMTATAQAGSWKTTTHEGDELTGSQTYTSYQYYANGTGAFVCFGWNDPEFRIFAEKGVFEESVYYTGFGESQAVKVLVGIYEWKDNKPVLLERFNIFMDVENHSLGDKITINRGSLKREKKKALKIMQALTTKNRIVRFICPRYAQSALDLCVPYYH